MMKFFSKLVSRFWDRMLKSECDYCHKKVDLFYDATIFPLDKFKGDRICRKCVYKEKMKPNSRKPYKDSSMYF